MGRFLPASLVLMLKEEGSDAMIRAFDNDTENPELIWDGMMRKELKTSLSEQLDIYLIATKGNGVDSFELHPNFYIQYEKIVNEVFVGNVFLKLFLKTPTYNLRDSSQFLELLMKHWSQEIESSCKEVSENPFQNKDMLNVSNQEMIQLLTDVIVCLCKAQSSVVHKLSSWGYMSILTSFLHQLMKCQLTNVPLISTIRIIHVAVSQKSNVEVLSTISDNNGKNGIVDYLMKAVGEETLHIDSGYILKVLREIFNVALGDIDVKKNTTDKTEELMENNDVESDNDGTDNVTFPSSLSDEINDSQQIPLSMPSEPPPALPSDPPPSLPSEPPPPPPLDFNEHSSSPISEDPSSTNADQRIMGDHDQNGLSIADEINTYTPAPILGGVDATANAPASLVAERQTVSILGAPGSIEGRAALLHSCLECSLPHFLVEEVLENPSLEKVKDSSAVIVHAIALLKLLIMDPGYGMKFNLILDCLPNWKKYESQDHMLLMSGEQDENNISNNLTHDGGNGTKMIDFG